MTNRDMLLTDLRFAAMKLTQHADHLYRVSLERPTDDRRRELYQDLDDIEQRLGEARRALDKLKK